VTASRSFIGLLAKLFPFWLTLHANDATYNIKLKSKNTHTTLFAIKGSKNFKKREVK